MDSCAMNHHFSLAQTRVVLPIIGFSLVVLEAFNGAVSVTVDGPSLEYFAILNITLRFAYI